MTGKNLEASAQLLFQSLANLQGSVFYDISRSGMHHRSFRKTQGVAEGRYVRELARAGRPARAGQETGQGRTKVTGRRQLPAAAVRLPQAACLQSAATRISWQIIKLSFFFRHLGRRSGGFRRASRGKGASGLPVLTFVSCLGRFVNECREPKGAPANTGFWCGFGFDIRCGVSRQY